MYPGKYYTINSRKSECDHKCDIRNAEPEIGTDGSCQTRRNPRVDGYGSGLGPRSVCGSGFCTVQEPNRPIFADETRTTGGLPRPVANTSELQSKTPRSKWYIADKTNLDGEKLEAALDEFGEVRLRRRIIRPEETPTSKRKLMHIGMYFVAPMLLLRFLMMCRSRIQRGRNLGSQVFADTGMLRSLKKFPCRAILLYFRLCGSQHCWEEGG
jgi:hypothetical protein